MVSQVTDVLTPPFSNFRVLVHFKLCRLYKRKKQVSPTIDEVEKVLHAGTLRLLRRLGKNCNVPETDLIYTCLDDNVMQSERSNLDKGY